jgi:hypothetical protein
MRDPGDDVQADNPRCQRLHRRATHRAPGCRSHRPPQLRLEATAVGAPDACGGDPTPICEGISNNGGAMGPDAWAVAACVTSMGTTLVAAVA